VLTRQFHFIKQINSNQIFETFTWRIYSKFHGKNIPALLIPTSSSEPGYSLRSTALWTHAAPHSIITIQRPYCDKWMILQVYYVGDNRHASIRFYFYLFSFVLLLLRIKGTAVTSPTQPDLRNSVYFLLLVTVTTVRQIHLTKLCHEDFIPISMICETIFYFCSSHCCYSSHTALTWEYCFVYVRDHGKASLRHAWFALRSFYCILKRPLLR
jgi:hypothetical protein